MNYALIIAATTSLAVLGGCAATSSMPAGMKVGRFVTYKCDGGKQLQARLAEGGSRRMTGACCAASTAGRASTPTIND